MRTGFITQNEYESINNDCVELNKLLISIINQQNNQTKINNKYQHPIDEASTSIIVICQLSIVNFTSYEFTANQTRRR